MSHDALGPIGPVSGVFNGSRITFTDAAWAMYDSAQDRTNVVGQLSADASIGATQVQLIVPGRSAGTFACMGGAGGVAILFTGAVGQYSSTTATQCDISIDRFGLVGAIVSGSFSGELYATSRTGDTPQQIHVTDGEFQVIRSLDQ